MKRERLFLIFLLFATFLISGIAFAQDDPILARAKDGIKLHRMGDITIKVTDVNGRPIAGAQVEVEMLRHQFLFGCNIFTWGRFTLLRDEQTYRDRFVDLFNYATLPFYWSDYEKQEGKPDHEYREQVARWCKEKGITTKGHPLIWTAHGVVPKWLPDNPDEVRRSAINRVSDCVTRFKGLIDIWDVVNEAVDPYAARDPLNWKDNRLQKAFQRIGTVRMVKDMFAAARAANLQATLLINDYRIEPKYKDLLDLLRNNGKPIYDAIGIQSHMQGGVWSSQKIWDICEEYARFGVPLHFTETTIVSSGKRLGPRENWGPTDPALEKKQAKEAERFYTILFGHPAVEAITWWDFADDGAWGAAGGYLRKDLSPKRIYYSLQKLIREDWWTKAVLNTDETGTARIRAFFGDYQIRVKKDAFFSSKKITHDRKDRQTHIGLVLIEKH